MRTLLQNRFFFFKKMGFIYFLKKGFGFPLKKKQIFLNIFKYFRFFFFFEGGKKI